MKIISLERTPKRVELLKRMVDKNKLVADEAKEAFASFISPVIQIVLNQKVTSSAIYQDAEFSENDRPTIPIDLYLGTKENYFRVWSQTVPGGLPTNMVQGLGEYTFTTYELDSAIAFMNYYLKNARLDVMTQGMERMINEIAVKQERNAWGVILNALAVASTPQAIGADISHVISATTPGQFQLHDLNKLWTYLARLYTSYTGGTPDTVNPPGLTDLFCSPEIIEDIRAFAYNPMNIRGGYSGGGSTEMTGGSGIPLPDAVRAQFFSAGGVPEIFNVSIHQMVEFGVGKKYNTVFDNFYSGSFTGSTQEIIVGADLSRPVFLRPVVVDEDTGGQVTVRPDDQFVSRSEKTGFYAKVKEGRVILDDRALVGLIV
jgi:hypothetical protein